MTISKFGKKSRLYYIDVRNNIISDITVEHDKDIIQGFQIFDRNILKTGFMNAITKTALIISYIRDYGAYEKKSETDFVNKKCYHTKSDEYLKK